MNHYKQLNFDVVAVSDIWNRHREEGAVAWKVKMEHEVTACRTFER